MSILSAADLAKSFGADDVFSNVSLSVPRGARIAIVGPNGIGKTTLLRILVGEDEPTSGKVARSRGLTFSYLPQEADLTADHSLWEECLSAFDELRLQEAELGRLEAAMGDPAQAGQILERYGELQEMFDRQGGYTYEIRIRQVLTGLGFEAADFDRPLKQLSGGQRTRALLSRLLLSNPDLLVLDEPTNHLDIAAVEWLEGYLSNWEGSAMIVSHDRYFLDRVVDHIWEMSRTGLEAYSGDYSAYLQQRGERWQLRREIYDSEMERLEKELDYIKRNIAGQRVQQAKGKLRRLSRQVEALESLGFEAVLGKRWLEISEKADISTHTMGVAEVERRIRSLKPPHPRPHLFAINLKAAHRSGEIVLRTQELVVGYPGDPLFSSIDLELRRLECAAIIGPNGAGKTTFLKTILGEHPPLSGEVVQGASLIVGYFAQAHEDLRPERRLVEEIESVAPGMLEAEIRSFLARFLFTGEDVFRRVSTLSGGERGRLALAKLSLTDANLLLLDEPTNHLDIPSQEILQEVLAGFQGTILLVSHDRYLIDALATQIWDIDPERGSLRLFQGTYSEYRAQLDAERSAAEGEIQEVKPRPKERKNGRPSNAERARHVRLQEVESRIAQLEEELARLRIQLEDPPADQQVVQELGEDYVQIQNELEVLVLEWETLHLN
jgi:ATP-binding cassette, subfamily F, member 3